MTKKHRIALSRILSDLINADKHVYISELEYFEEIIEKYKISTDERIEAATIDFKSAIDSLKSLNKNEREELINTLFTMSLIDGECSREEALILLAIKYTLSEKHGAISQIISSNRHGREIKNNQLVFVEYGRDDYLNKVIAKNLRVIQKEALVTGFEFFYIPAIVENIFEFDKTKTYSLFSFIQPDIDESEIRRIVDCSKQYNTDYFRKDILCHYFDMDLRETNPSIILRISRNTFIDKEIVNFLKISITSNIVNELRGFFDGFLNLTKVDILNIKNIRMTGSLQYHGLIKLLIDRMTKRDAEKSIIVIDKKKRIIYFKDKIKFNLNIGLKEKAFYALLLFETKNKGLCFRRSNYLNDKTYSEKMKSIQSKYKKMYGMFGDREDTPDITDEKIRNPIISRIRKAIQNEKRLTNSYDYLPLYDSKGYLKIGISENMIYINKIRGNTPILLAESNGWEG